MFSRTRLVLAWVLTTVVATGASLAAVRLVNDEPAPPGPPTLVETTLAPVVTPATTGSTAASAGVGTLPQSTATSANTSLPAIPTLTTPTDLNLVSPPSSGFATTTTISPTEATTATSPTTTTTTTQPPTTFTTTTTVPSTTTTTTVPDVTGPFTFQVTGGTVTVTCQGDDVDLSGAVPSQGYSVEVDKAGPGEVRVFFTGSGEETEVRIECQGGVASAEIK